MRERIKIVVVALLAWGLSLVRPAVLPADAAVCIPDQPVYLALTFDDGPKRVTTSRLLDGLRERGASATFFLIGEQIAGNEDLVERMHREGHQVGNHTWSHAYLEKLPPEKLVAEIQRTEETLEAILGEEDYWLRPPYGRLQETQQGQIKTPLVQWSVDPEDWKYKDQKRIVSSVLQQIKPNAIILLHDIYPTSVDAALELVDVLQEQGYFFVTVEELLQINQIEPRSGTFYLHG